MTEYAERSQLNYVCGVCERDYRSSRGDDREKRIECIEIGASG